MQIMFHYMINSFKKEVSKKKKIAQGNAPEQYYAIHLH